LVKSDEIKETHNRNIGRIYSDTQGQRCRQQQPRPLSFQTQVIAVEPEQFEILTRKLDLILKLLALDKLHGKKQIEQVAILTDFGMRPSEIAAVLGLETSNVTAQQAQLKTRPRKKAVLEE